MRDEMEERQMEGNMRDVRMHPGYHGCTYGNCLPKCMNGCLPGKEAIVHLSSLTHWLRVVKQAGCTLSHCPSPSFMGSFILSPMLCWSFLIGALRFFSSVHQMQPCKKTSTSEGMLISVQLRSQKRNHTNNCILSQKL